MKFINICVVVMLLMVSSCAKKDTTVNLKFDATYRNATLAFSPNTVTDDSANVVKYEELNFLLSNIELVREDNSVAKLADVSYVDFVNTENSGASLFSDVPVGTYKALRFSIGLDSAQNEQDPSEIGDSDPRQKAQYWGWMKYVFMRIEGKAQLANTSGGFNQLLVFHTGTDVLYRTITLNGPIVINEGDNTLQVNFELNKIFFGAKPLDIKLNDESFTHSESTSASYHTAVNISDNLQQAFSIGQ